MDKSEQLATQGTQDEEKQNKNNTICVGYHYVQTSMFRTCFDMDKLEYI